MNRKVCEYDKERERERESTLQQIALAQKRMWQLTGAKCKRGSLAFKSVECLASPSKRSCVHIFGVILSLEHQIRGLGTLESSKAVSNARFCCKCQGKHSWRRALLCKDCIPSRPEHIHVAATHNATPKLEMRTNGGLCGDRCAVYLITQLLTLLLRHRPAMGTTVSSVAQV